MDVWSIIFPERNYSFYEADSEITPAEFRKQIGKELPKYMLPTVFYYLDELQRNTNGKIDRLFYNKQVNG